MSIKPTVSVVMITYKHAKYIKQAIEGVLMQQCNFEIELIIADDCSPDATATIVKQLKSEHPNGNWINYVKHTVNKGMNLNFSWAMQKCNGKYIALCEGDDYWIDSKKLKKQIGFLEENKDVVICGTLVKTVTKENKVQQNSKLNFQGQNLLYFSRNEVLNNNPFDTCSVVFRNMKITQNILQGYSAPDWILYLHLLKKGNGCILNDTTAVYNFHGNGIASSLTHNTYLQNRLQDRLLCINANIEDKKSIKKGGLLIIWNYFKQALRFRKVLIMALFNNSRLVINYLAT